MSGFRFSLNSVPSGQVCFISLIFLFFLPVSFHYIHLCFCSVLLFMALSLSLHRHTLFSHAYAHTLSLGYYQDKSIWSIQGSGCHFIHIFSSLVTLLKATASIYPEWMNAPTDETRGGKNETHTAWNDQSQSACHFQNMFGDSCVLNAIEEGKKKKKKWAWWCFLFICKQASDSELACPPCNDKRIAVEIPSLARKNEML